MKKMYLEIITAVTSLAIFLILILAAKLIKPEVSGYGYSVALLVFVIIMGFAGLKLAEMPDK